jgi:hypothetical protein
MAPRSLQEVTEGTVTSADDADYEARRRAVIWNRLTPNRRPCVIVEAASEADVIEDRWVRPRQSVTRRRARWRP